MCSSDLSSGRPASYIDDETGERGRPLRDDCDLPGALGISAWQVYGLELLHYSFFFVRPNEGKFRQREPGSARSYYRLYIQLNT